MTWRIDKSRIGPWHEYDIFRDDEKVARARWRLRSDNNAELHNELLQTSKSVLAKAREVLHEVVRPDMRSEGAERIVVVNTEDKASVIVRYWSFMGFEYVCGIMEV